MPFNLYEDQLMEALVSLLKGYATGFVQIVKGEVADYAKLPVEDVQEGIQKLPLVAVTALRQEEAIYQSGIYQTTIEFLTKIDIDRQTSKEAGVLFGSVLDFVQQATLKEQINQNFTNLNIQGIVLGTMTPVEVADRMWLKRIECDFFGHSMV